MTLAQDGLYCPGCGYDLRGLTSQRCPECGLVIDSTHSGTIPWEHRKSIGYFIAFVRTLGVATFSPVRFARGAGPSVDVRSARLFRWIVRVLVFIPCATLFIFILNVKGAADGLIIAADLFHSGLNGWWEAMFLWQVGATFLPILPIGFFFTLILSTGVSQWFHMRRLAPVQNQRAMVFSYYLCAPFGWIFVPCGALATGLWISQHDEGMSKLIGDFQFASGIIFFVGCVLIVLATLNWIRAVNVITRCGVFRSLVVGAGVVGQCAASIAIGLILFPMIAGLWRLAAGSIWP